MLSGKLHITNVDAAGIDLARLPPASPPEEPPDDAPAGPLEIPTLPIDIQVDSIQVRDIALTEPVVGEAMVLDLSGQVAGDVGGTVQTDLRLERTDADGLVTLTSELDPTARTLSVDLDVREPEGGLIARLLGLAPYPPVTVSLKGEGPLDAWRAHLAAEVQGLVDVTAALRIDRDQVTNVSLDGRADVSGMLEDPLKPLVAGGISFSVGAHARDLDAVTVDHLKVATKAVAVTGSGHADLADARIDATVNVSAPTGADLEPLLSPLRVGAVAGDIKLSGALTAPAVDLVASVGDLTMPGVMTTERLDLSAGTDLSRDPVGIEARIDAHGFDLGDPAAAALTGETATIEVSGAFDMAAETLTIDRIEAGSGPTSLSGHGRFGLSTQQVAAALDAAVADVSELGKALDMPLAGRARLSAETEGNLETLNLEGSWRGEISQPSIGNAEADELLRGGVRLSGSFDLAGADNVRFDADVDAGDLLELRAEGRIDDTIAADATVKAADLSAFSRLAGVALSGALSMTAHAEGSVEDATGTLSVELRDAAVDTVAIPAADLKIAASDLMQNPVGRAVPGRSDRSRFGEPAHRVRRAGLRRAQPPGPRRRGAGCAHRRRSERAFGRRRHDRPSAGEYRRTRRSQRCRRWRRRTLRGRSPARRPGGQANRQSAVRRIFAVAYHGW